MRETEYKEKVIFSRSGEIGENWRYSSRCGLVHEHFMRARLINGIYVVDLRGIIGFGTVEGKVDLKTQNPDEIDIIMRKAVWSEAERMAKFRGTSISDYVSSSG